MNKTETQFRAADQQGMNGLLEQCGINLFGLSDAVRLYSEYDPKTGEKPDVWDRLKAGGDLVSKYIPGVGLAQAIVKSDLGKELLGINDAIRIFASHDPVTRKKLYRGDHLAALGWTVLNLAETVPIS
ncbi:pre-toxin TG domain-containing protein [Fictibacillus enclensis]|uniref:pre-toxin TG domain-containing protein n=1 Tax=Fictibacillus enclensis TaxID=1017270 RepID=UPI0025A0D949|nr:pre-toxin TG domain-containing protein [Fictibacillus enclensis]MDM5336418.1 pre-toxin TG domain-containing protein [Fictibacillus enclensis]